jgi:excisionase family DNA binding protein
MEKLPSETEVESHGEPLLTIQQAADMLGVSKNTLRRWCRLGILECYRINQRGDRRFTVTILQKVMTPSRPGRPKGSKSSHGEINEE